MTVYNLYIYNRKGECIYYKEWNRAKKSGLAKDQEFHQMFGLIIEMKSFVNKMSPTDLARDDYFSYKTSRYKLNYYETATGIKLVLNTDCSVGNIRDLMHQIYQNILFEYVVKNPLTSLNETINSELFEEKLDEFMKNTTIFAN